MTRTVIVTGYAKMPTGTTVRALYGTLAMGTLVDIETHMVVEGWTSLFSEASQRFVAGHLVGQNLMAEDSAFVDAIRRDYWGNAQAAICQCYRDMVRRYREHLAAEIAGDRAVDDRAGTFSRNAHPSDLGDRVDDT